MWKAVALASVLVGTATFAQAPTDAPAGTRGPNNDPDQIVCQNEVSTGSRVAQRRVCRTRAEWTEYRAQARLVTERVQFNKQTCEAMAACMQASRLGR